MEQTKSRRVFFIVALIVAMLIAGAILYALQNANKATEVSTGNENQSDATTGPKEPESEAAPTPSERVSITYTDDGFEPKDIEARKGNRITITNKSSSPIQFSSDNHPSHQENTEMNLKTISPGESESYTASSAGEWGYHDHIDASKTGTVTVEE